MSQARAISFVLAKETGDLTEDPNDPGGLTRWGIALCRHPELCADDIRNMSRDRAAIMYAGPQYWGAIKGDQLPMFIQLPMLDYCVTSGPHAAITSLQHALYLPVDGVLGPQTLHAASVSSAQPLVARITGSRIFYLSTLDGWPHDGHGWAERAVEAAMESM